MPTEYDIKTKQFAIGGRKVSRREVREQINLLLDRVERESARLGKSYRGKLISATQFEAGMQGLLRSAHIIAASVGKGGRALMTKSDWGKVGAKIKWQYGYLRKFAEKIGRKAVSETAAASRAKSYASAVYVSFANTFQDAQKEFVEGGKNPELCRLVTNSKEGCEECAADEAEGWMSVDDMGPIGSRICQDWCKCDIVFQEDEGEDLKITVKVTVND